MKKTKKGDLVECPKCFHRFVTKSRLRQVSCNSCGGKFKREENIIRSRNQEELTNDWREK